MPVVVFSEESVLFSSIEGVEYMLITSSKTKSGDSSSFLKSVVDVSSEEVVLVVVEGPEGKRDYNFLIAGEVGQNMQRPRYIPLGFASIYFGSSCGPRW